MCLIDSAFWHLNIVKWFLKRVLESPEEYRNSAPAIAANNSLRTFVSMKQYMIVTDRQEELPQAFFLR